MVHQSTYYKRTDGCEPFLEESRDLMEAIVCSGYTGGYLQRHELEQGVEISAWLLTRTKKRVFVRARYKHVRIQ